MVPKESGFNQSETIASNAHAHLGVFQARLSLKVMVKLNKGSIIVITETHFGIKSGYVTTKLHETSTYRCNNKAIFSDRAIFKFPVVYITRRGPCQHGLIIAMCGSMV